MPAGCLVFNGTVVMLKPRIAFLSWLLCSTVLIEASNSKPGTICRCLASLRIETHRKGKIFGKLGAVDLQGIVSNATPIHPELDAFIADELDGANGLINRALLVF